MRLAIMLETHEMGGAEVMILDLARALRERDHEVHYIGPEHPENWPLAQFKADGFATHTFRHRAPFDFSCRRAIEQILVDNHIEVLHGHEFLACLYGAAIRRNAGVPLVATFHGNPRTTGALRRRIALRVAVRRAAAVTAVSTATEGDLRRAIGPGTPLTIIKNGVRFVPGNPETVRRELGVAAGIPLLLAAGTMTERKAHIHLLQALTQVPADLPWQLMIAGRYADATDQLRAFVAEHDWERRVHILGPRSDMPDIHAAADIFVMPSLWEGLPLALLEAMLAGRPVVATRTQGIPEVVTHGQEGLLSEVANVPALARSLVQLLRDPVGGAKMGRAARDVVQARFSHAAMTTHYENCYREVRTGVLARTP